MPNINEKGVSVPQWVASFLLMVMMTLMGWAFNQQATLNDQQSDINKEFLEAIYLIKSDLRMGSKDFNTLNEDIGKLESENKELRKQNELQQREIDELKRYHR